MSLKCHQNKPVLHWICLSVSLCGINVILMERIDLETHCAGTPLFWLAFQVCLRMGCWETLFKIPSAITNWCLTAVVKCPTVSNSCRTIVLSILKNVRLLKAGTGQMSDHEFPLGKSLHTVFLRWYMQRLIMLDLRKIGCALQTKCNFPVLH